MHRSMQTVNTQKLELYMQSLQNLQTALQNHLQVFPIPYTDRQAFTPEALASWEARAQNLHKLFEAVLASIEDIKHSQKTQPVCLECTKKTEVSGNYNSYFQTNVADTLNEQASPPLSRKRIKINLNSSPKHNSVQAEQYIEDEEDSNNERPAQRRSMAQQQRRNSTLNFQIRQPQFAIVQDLPPSTLEAEEQGGIEKFLAQWQQGNQLWPKELQYNALNRQQSGELKRAPGLFMTPSSPNSPQDFVVKLEPTHRLQPASSHSQNDTDHAQYQKNLSGVKKESVSSDSEGEYIAPVSQSEGGSSSSQKRENKSPPVQRQKIYLRSKKIKHVLQKKIRPLAKKLRKRNYVRGPYKKLAPEEKKEIILAYNSNKGQSLSQIANQYKIPVKNIKRWIQHGIQRKKGGGRHTLDPQMEDILQKHIKDLFKKKNQRIARHYIRQKALEYTQYPEKFSASKGWLEKFIKRFNLKDFISNNLKPSTQTSEDADQEQDSSQSFNSSSIDIQIMDEEKNEQQEAQSQKQDSLECNEVISCHEQSSVE